MEYSQAIQGRARNPSALGMRAAGISEINFQNIPQKGLFIAVEGMGTQYEMFQAQHIRDTFSLYNHVLSVINAEAEPSSMEVGCAVASLIATVMADDFDDIKALVRGIGVGIRTVRVPADVEDPDTMIGSVDDFRKVFMAFAQVVLVLFKNISQPSYDNYIKARIRALASNLMLSASEAVQTLQLADAIKVRETIGNNIPFKKRVLETVLAYAKRDTTTGMGSVCRYLAEMLKWTEMSGVMFMNSTLVIQGSPVLDHPEVDEEVINLHETYEEITSFQFPEYYRILGPPLKQHLLHRSRFPHLLAVAHRIKGEKHRTVQNFNITIPGTNPTLVDRLYTIHRERQTAQLAYAHGVSSTFFKAHAQQVQNAAPQNAAANPPQPPPNEN